MGRLWTVRVAPYGHPSAGVLRVVCGVPGCPIGPLRFRDREQTRKAALDDLLRHVREAGPVLPGVSCRCRVEEHAWHPGWVRCQRSGVRVIAGDATRTAWRVMEVCQPCAQVIPRGKVLPQPPSSEDTTGSGEDSSGRESAPSPSEEADQTNESAIFRTPASPKKKLDSATPGQVWDEHDTAAARAVACVVCAQQGVSNLPPPLEPPHEASQVPHQAPGSPGADETDLTKTPTSTEKPDLLSQETTEPEVKRLLTAPQGVAARKVLEYVAGLPVVGPPARLLGLVLTVRAARAGQANLTGQDLRALKLPNAEETVGALVASGWVTEALTQVLHLDQSTPVAIEVPDLGQDSPLAMGRQTRTRVSGWTTRTMAAKPLRKAFPQAKLVGLWLAAHATPKGAGVLEVEAVTRLTDCDGDALSEVLDWLETTGWLTEHSEAGSYQLAPVALPFIPPVVEPPPSARPPGHLSWSQRRAAAAELIGRPVQYASWLEEYWLVHRHGPSREVFIRTHWPDAPAEVADMALDRLGSVGWLFGVRAPYALRPGRCFHPRVT